MSEERKLVTILFADVMGSTALGDALDPEDVHALMGRYYQHGRQIVPAHGGTLEKFIGDAVMAVFGLPQAHGNDAECALAAALQDAERLAELVLATLGLRRWAEQSPNRYVRRGVCSLRRSHMRRRLAARAVPLCSMLRDESYFTKGAVVLGKICRRRWPTPPRPCISNISPSCGQLYRRPTTTPSQ